MRFRVRRCFLVLVALVAVSAAPARADWTTYHGDPGRTGLDLSSATTPAPFAPAWTSPDLGGKIYAEPLVYHGVAIVATEGNDVFALSEATGQVVWHAHVGTPVPSTVLPCGGISPTVGITSTPVVDPGSGTVYVVADLWDGSNPHHMLVAYSALTGAQLWTKNVDPAGSIPVNQLQRPALNLSGGRVLIGFGGNDGDCATYWGWLVSVAEDGSSMTAWQGPTSTGDAIWGASGPAVDSSGAVYAATGNGASGDPSQYDYGDSVVKFANPASSVATDYFAPSDWPSLNTNDLDLGSAGTLLLPGNLAFQAGKGSTGYLISTTSLGHVGGELYQAPIGCSGMSFGGDAYANGIIYVPCDTGGLIALTLNTSNPGHPTFSPRWQGPSDSDGSPIVAGGRVWVPSYSNGVLYGLDPLTGAVDTQQSTPGMGGVHFTTPAASDGKLVLATSATVEAYTIASPVTAVHTLSVAEAGTGDGAVAGDESPRLVCPGACSQSYPAGTSVTLTEAAVAGSAFAGWSGGGCSGTASTCTVALYADTHVTATFTATAAGNATRPTTSGASLSGVAQGHARLVFTLHAGRRGRGLETVAVTLPAGLSFNGMGLARGLAVTGAHGKHTKFTTKLRHGVLTIVLRTPQRTVTVTLGPPALRVARKLARQMSQNPGRELRIGVRATDAGGRTTRLKLTLRA